MRSLHAVAIVTGCALIAAGCSGDSPTAPAVDAASVANFLPDHNALRARLREILEEENGGLGFEMWATILDRNGRVVDVVFSGEHRGDQWPGSRVISAQKANTGNAFSLDGFALSSANLFAAVQPGGSLFGLQESNPVDTDVAYAGPVSAYGKANDPMIGKRIGGINVFGGGLALYSASGVVARRHRRQRRYLVHRPHRGLEAPSLAQPGQRARGARPRQQHRQHHLHRRHARWVRTPELLRHAGPGRSRSDRRRAHDDASRGIRRVVMEGGREDYGLSH